MTILRGRVVDPDDRPEIGATVYILSAPVSMPDIAQITDERGEFMLAVTAPGCYSLGSRSERWGTAQTEVMVGNEAVLEVKIKFIFPGGD